MVDLGLAPNHHFLDICTCSEDRNGCESALEKTIAHMYMLFVAGKEFRALFISTVRTSLTCYSFDRRQSESQSLYWEFLSDPKLLNTAITRAMSLVAVVGDPVSLCTAGDCRGNWRDYIRRCHERGTLQGASYQDIKNKIDAPLANICLNPQAIEFVPQLMEVNSKQVKSLRSQPQIYDSEISSSVEKSDLEVERNEKMLASGKEDGRNIATEKKGSGNKRDDAKEDITQEESTAKEEKEEEEEEQQQQQEQRASQFSADSQNNELNSERRSEYQQGIEPESGIQSQEEEDDDVGQSTSDGFEEFLRESFEDETVFPRYLDKIIKALVEKCKATKEKEARLHGSSENAAFPSLHAATSRSYMQKSKTGKRSGKRTCQAKSSSFDCSSEDYEICVVNGRQEVRIVNLGFQQTPTVRHQRLTTISTQDDFLDSQLLQKLLVEEPDKYLPCTLRLNSEIIRTAYAEISDTKTPAIKIRGRVRGAFDMDHVVVEKTDACAGVPSSQGKVAGKVNSFVSSF